MVGILYKARPMSIRTHYYHKHRKPRERNEGLERSTPTGVTPQFGHI